MSDRYTDKPFLRFVDAWVLKAIDHLDPETEAYCQAMAPQLEQSFGVKGSWEQIVARQMKFGLSEGMVTACGPGGPEVFLLALDEGATPGMRVH